GSDRHSGFPASCNRHPTQWQGGGRASRASHRWEAPPGSDAPEEQVSPETTSAAAASVPISANLMPWPTTSLSTSRFCAPSAEFFGRILPPLGEATVHKSVKFALSFVSAVRGSLATGLAEICSKVCLNPPTKV